MRSETTRGWLAAMVEDVGPGRRVLDAAGSPPAVLALFRGAATEIWARDAAYYSPRAGRPDRVLAAGDRARVVACWDLLAPGGWLFADVSDAAAALSWLAPAPAYFVSGDGLRLAARKGEKA